MLPVLFFVTNNNDACLYSVHNSLLTIIMSASQFEQENDNQFHLLANKVSAFKNIANDINNYSREDNNQLNLINDQLSNLSNSIKTSATRLTHVMKANPKITKMVGLGFVIFLIIYYSVKYLF